MNKSLKLRKLPINRPVNPILKSIGSGVYHYQEKRLINIDELKRLASFPDNYKVTNSFNKQWAVIGNAVMPKMMQSIAGHIKTEVFNQL